jgi:hypothetical protein
LIDYRTNGKTYLFLTNEMSSHLPSASNEHR